MRTLGFRLSRALVKISISNDVNCGPTWVSIPAYPFFDPRPVPTFFLVITHCSTQLLGRPGMPCPVFALYFPNQATFMAISSLTDRQGYRFPRDNSEDRNSPPCDHFHIEHPTPSPLSGHLSVYGLSCWTDISSSCLLPLSLRSHCIFNISVRGKHELESQSGIYLVEYGVVICQLSARSTTALVTDRGCRRTYIQLAYICFCGRENKTKKKKRLDKMVNEYGPRRLLISV